MTHPQIRCTIFNASIPSDGKVILFNASISLSEFLSLASDKLHIRARHLAFENGAEIDDPSLIRDNDTIYVSSDNDRNSKHASSKTNRSNPSSAVSSSSCPLVSIAVMGPGSVGKSAVTLSYVQGIFMEEYDPTIEDAYRKNTVVDGELCMLDILDTAGQENYYALRSTWMRERDGFLLVFSLADRSTFDGLRTFYDQLCDTHEKEVPPCLLIGNKSDMELCRQVSYEEGAQLAQEFNAKYIETSAKSGQNISNAFQSLVTEILKLKRHDRPQPPVQRRWWCSIV